MCVKSGKEGLSRHKKVGGALICGGSDLRMTKKKENLRLGGKRKKGDSKVKGEESGMGKACLPRPLKEGEEKNLLTPKKRKRENER